MTGRKNLRRYRAAVVLSALLAVAGVTFLGLHYSQAQPLAFAPQIAATFDEKDTKLIVGVVLTPAQQQGTGGKLQLGIVDAQGKTLAQATKDKLATDDFATYRFEFPIKKDQAPGLTVLCQLPPKSHKVALNKILLAKGHETSLFTSQELFAGSKSIFQCDVHGVRSVKETMPLPGSEVKIQIHDKDNKETTLFEGRTNSDGRAEGEFKVPLLDSGNYQLTVLTKSPLGEEKLTRNVKIKSDAKILLLSDKPIYQPGQVIHLRALALQPFDLKPVASADLAFEVEDSKGNKVFKKIVKTSDFGVAAIDFELASEVNMGNYQLRATLAKQTTEKTVVVKRYVLPKFKVNVTSDKQYYLPKETIKAELQADYFFGKPVANSKVEVKASTFDVEFKEFKTWKGTTDDKGHVKFEIQLPDYFVGQPLQKGNAIVKLDVKVIDTADHKEEIAKSYTVSDQPIQVNLIPEGGKLAIGLENRIFAAAVYPDGSPAECEVSLWAGKEAKGEPLATVKTNASGLAEFKLNPKAEQFRQGGSKQQTVEMLGGNQQFYMAEFLFDVYAQAKDKKGNQAKTTLALNRDPNGRSVLLRLNKAIYNSAETVELDIRSAAGTPTVYVDIVRGGQIVLSKWFEVRDGKVEQKIELPSDLFGSLEVHAYQVLKTSEIIRDSRVIYVQPRDDLHIDVKANKKEFAPGESGQIQFLVTDSKGKGVQAALGIIVVDEAVYALQELQPGLEKVYFTLQEELMKPQAQVLQYTGGQDIKGLVQMPALPAGKQQVAQVLLTAVKVQPPARWQVDPALQRKNEFDGKVLKTGWALYSYAWSTESAFQYDEKQQQWTFRSDVFKEMITKGHLSEAYLQVPLGDKLTLAKLMETEKQFDAQHLAGAITKYRLKQLAEAVVAFSEANKKELYQNGKWTFAQGTLMEAAKAKGLVDYILRDAWGQGFKLVKSDKKAANKTGHSQFDQYEIVSAGPDRDYMSGDDIGWTQVSEDKSVEGWWSEDSSLQVAQFLPDPTKSPYQLEKLREQLDLGAAQGKNMAFDRFEMMKKFDGHGGFGGGGPIAGGLPGAPGPAEFPPMAKEQKAAAGKGGFAGEDQKSAGGGGTAPVVKVREYFPETMLWQPSLITDEKGEAILNINFADSITTWRLSASASSKAGALGSSTATLKVFQDFFVDIDLPVSLTQNDEVAFPVAIYNYLKEPQTIKLELQKETWFEMLPGEEMTRSIELKPNEVTATHFHIRAKKVGFQPLTIKALGTKKSDAVKRVVEVVPDGKKVEVVVSDQLKGKVNHTLTIPQDAIPDASKLIVRVYPGVMAQVLEGLEGMMRMPGGCFEQTSSSAYPNILVVDYIKKNKLANAELLLKAESYLNTGYQRLLTFERPGGGFDWWGSGEPLVWLSAYGLQEFNDMSKVWPIDKGIIDRTQNFLMKKMDKDGTWADIGATHGETIANMGNTKLLLTSYVAWSLLESGMPKNKVAHSIDYIRANVKDSADNAYILALAANALASFDPKDDSTIQVLNKLQTLKKEVPEWKACCFGAKTQSINYASGKYVEIETTALSVLAMVKTGQFTNTVNQAMAYLVKSKEGNGTWGSTSATILSLKALLAGMTAPEIKGTLNVNILVNGKQAGKAQITQENAEVMQLFDLQEHTQVGANDVQIQVDGDTSLMYQVVGRHFEPWKKDVQPEKKSDFEFKVDYDRTKLATHDMLKVKATVKYVGKLPANMVMVDLGIAPGFNVDAGDFAEMVDKKHISKFSITSRQVILYLNALAPGESRSFEYTLNAKYPLRAQTPPSTVYEYYTPNNQAVAAPTTLTVTNKK